MAAAGVDEHHQHLDRIARDGYTVIEHAIDATLVDALAADLQRLERQLEVKPAANSFEGTRTLRIYNLLVLGVLWREIPVHPAVLPIVEGVLDDGCLVSSLSSIDIGAGETAQPIHADDQLIPLAKPHVATVCNTMWALTDFTEANGATRVIPGCISSIIRPTSVSTTTASRPRCPKAVSWSGTAACGMAAGPI
jgi:ectoine hydroxylase-related dioxygenase (phytanoyl-CoA dioxygenase family)